MSSPRSFSFLMPAKTIFVPASTVSEIGASNYNAGAAPLMNFFGTFSQASMASSSQVTSAFLKAPE